MSRVTASPVWLGAAASLMVLPLALVLGLLGFSFAWGFDGLAFVVGFAAGLAIWAIGFSPCLWDRDCRDLADFFSSRFGRLAAAGSTLVLFVSLLLILAAVISYAADVAARATGLPVWFASAGVACLTLLAGAAAFGVWANVVRISVLALALLSALVVPVFLPISGAQLGLLGVGHAVSEVARLEMGMLEGGLTDIDTFRLHTRPFLNLDDMQFLSVALVVALGVSLLLSVLATPVLASAKHVRSARIAAAFASLFGVLVLVALPFVAIYGKLALYTELSAGAPLGVLPPWLETASRAGLAHIYGLSAKLLEGVHLAVTAGARDVQSVSVALLAWDEQIFQRWQMLSVDLQASIVAGVASRAGEASFVGWAALQGEFVRAAALAYGDDAPRLVQASVVVEPAGVLYLISDFVALANLWFAAVLGILLFAALVIFAGEIAAAFARIASSAGAAQGSQLVITLLALLAAALLALAIKVSDGVILIMIAFSLLAAALFVPTVLGLVWCRANSLGAVAAIALGALVAATYAAGVSLAPVAFFETWAVASSAADYEVEDFRALQDAATSGSADKVLADASIVEQARGRFLQPGLANWFGIDRTLAGLIGLPVALLVMVLMSLGAGRRSPATDD